MWELTIKNVTLHPIALRLVSPFQTSFGTQHLRPAIIVRLEAASGAVGWGEVTADRNPGYSYETIFTAQHVLEDFLIPNMPGTLRSDEKWPWLTSVRGHPMAKHALISAMLTAVAAERGISLAKLLQEMSGAASTKARVEVGISIGIQPHIDETLKVIEAALADGYGRIKLKIKPGRDVDDLRRAREAFPDAVIMADANSAYSLGDADLLRELDAFDLLMIEQPLGYEDIHDHSLLDLATPICLDESLHTLGDVKLMHKIGAGQIVNLKPQRVGGLFEALAIHNFCAEQSIPLWVGGMLETAVGRAVSLALASLPAVTLPSDLSATRRYYDPEEDIAVPPFELNTEDSTVTVPTNPGLGVDVDMARLARAEAAFK